MLKACEDILSSAEDLKKNPQSKLQLVETKESDPNDPEGSAPAPKTEQQILLEGYEKKFEEF